MEGRNAKGIALKQREARMEEREDGEEEERKGDG